VYVNQTNLDVKFNTKMGGQPKIWLAMAHLGPLLEPPLGNDKTKHNQLPAIIWNFYYDAKKLLQTDDCTMITSS